MSCDNSQRYKNCGICGQSVPAEELGLLLDRQACQSCRRAAQITQAETFGELDYSEKELLHQIASEQRGNTWLLRGVIIAIAILVAPLDGSDLSPKSVAILAVLFVAVMLSIIPGKKSQEEIIENHQNLPEETDRK